jgi:putative oxidoreductase
MTNTQPSRSARTAARTASWFGQVVAAVILGQTLYFKFSGAPEAVWLFTELGVEPWGRVGLGVVELIAVVLLLVPRTAAIGAALSVNLMFGALFTHLVLVGIEIQGDGGLLFSLAIVALIASSVALFVRRAELPVIGHRLA